MICASDAGSFALGLTSMASRSARDGEDDTSERTAALRARPAVTPREAERGTELRARLESGAARDRGSMSDMGDRTSQ
jgi:hypothetical protein